ncbi:MAG: GyrI-like domain-containing protein [Candidatus Berkiella sp.]
MKKITTTKPMIKLVGLAKRTSNHLEQNAQTANIGPLVQHYFSNGIANSIKDRVSPGVTYSVYTDYESDHHGEYTYFIGEEVSSINDIPEGLRMITIPQSKYQRFTTQAGAMPAIVIQAWQSIWQMNPEDLGGTRRFIADFEIYDERAKDPSQSVVDIYIGIE